jgi:transcriptional regulator with XRE-family HTH domain
MQEMLLDPHKLRDRLFDRKLSEVARRTGIHPNVLYNFRSGKTTPRYETLAKLWEYLSRG